MPSHTPYDWAPVGHMLLWGGVGVVGLWGWLWHRYRAQGPTVCLQRCTAWALFLTFDLVLLGAYTRLSDSGLGCPDWPGCYGRASPWGAQSLIAEAEKLMPSGPVTWHKAWVEMVHRYMATAVGAWLILLLWGCWLQRHRVQLSLRWPSVAVLWVVVQGAFGAWTVTQRLQPLWVAAHLLGAMVLLALLRVQMVRLHTPAAEPGWGAGTRAALWSVLCLLGVQMASGVWVSANYAVLACQEFPLCQGRWWPSMDFAAGFEGWRPLGLRSDGSAVPFAALTAIHMTHRLLALVFSGAVLWLAWHVYRQERAAAAARTLLLLLAWQWASGLSNVVLGWPLVAALAHTAGAAAWVVVLTGWLAKPQAAHG